MNRTGLIRGLSAGVAIVALGCAASASSAQPERPYSGSCSTVVQVLTPPNVFPQELRIDLDCTLAHLGRTTGVAFRTVTPLGAPNGTILTTAIENATTYTAANGDMLDQSFIGTALINLETVKRNPNFPRYGNRKFPTRFTLRPLQYERDRTSTSP